MVYVEFMIEASLNTLLLVSFANILNEFFSIETEIPLKENFGDIKSPFR